MKISLQNKKESSLTCDVLILPLPEAQGAGPYGEIDTLVKGLISGAAASGEFGGKEGQLTLLHTQRRTGPKRILLVGLGRDANSEKLRRAGGATSFFLKNRGFKDIALSTKVISAMKLLPTDFLEGFLLSQYRFTRYRKNREGVLKNMTVLSRESLTEDIKRTRLIASATHFARDLVNTPANDMTPSALVRAARSLKKVSTRVIEKREAARLGMGAYLSVARGSAEEPKFIVLTYRRKNIRPIVLIGKTITFDSGGISLKRSEGMEKMKYDMAGGAAVLGAMKACSELELPLNVIGILPAAENLPGGSASRPGDVVTCLDGKTIEIITTDAEGRMVLADALGYSRRFRPSAVIDLATLTGATAVALGGEAMAMMGNDESLMARVQRASEETGERVWRMPLFDEYRALIESSVADLKNSGGREGALVTSGYFLKEFAGNTPWVHLDIAGMAWTDKDRPYVPQGATGVGVRLLVGFLRSL